MTPSTPPPLRTQPQWIELPCGLPEPVPSGRPPVLLVSPVPRRGRGERPRVVRVRARRRGR